MAADLCGILKALGERSSGEHDDDCPRDGSPCRHARAVIALDELNYAARMAVNESEKAGDPVAELLRILLKRHHPCRHGSRLASCEVGDWMHRNEEMLVGLRPTAKGARRT